MADIETEIDILRELDTLRVESGRLRNEGIEVLTALLEQGNNNKWFLFSVDINFLDDLKKGLFPEQLRQEFTNHDIHLSQPVTIKILEKDKRWQIIDGPQQYFIEAEEQSLNIYKKWGVSHLIYVVVAGCVGERWTVQPRYFTA